MGKITPPFPYAGEKYRDCVVCRKTTEQDEIDFYSGDTEPQVDEVLTGATSGSTATVAEVTTRSGSWGSDNVRGTIHVTGISDDFTEGETVNGSVGGTNLFTVHCNMKRRYGRKWPESMMTKFRGQWFCKEHFLWRWRKKLIDEQPFFIDEGTDREESS